ncbi:MAG: AAA family ATPase [Alphaproteobacteria bacterium]|nr:AAA family ATPase [Alphaproteobacteria bacterium]
MNATATAREIAGIVHLADGGWRERGASHCRIAAKWTLDRLMYVLASRTMQCPNCGVGNSPHANSCKACGTRLQVFCSSCGAPQLAHFRFCSSCGTRLEAGGPTTQGAVPPLATVAEGERRHVTVMFADVSGSLELIRDRDPEEARTIFDLVVETITAAIHRHRGTVNRVMGDGVLALFGAPSALEHHAVHACRAAFDVLKSVQALSDRVAGADGAEIRMHVGIDTGEVVVRSVTTDFHTEYDAVGRTVHLAARMQTLAPAGAVRISADTAREVRGFLSVRSLGHVPIKGLSEPVEVFEPVGFGTVSRFEVSKRRGLTRFVGRTRESQALAAAGQRVVDHGGELWSVSGEPGSGKSRLIHEFCRKAGDEGAIVVSAECPQQGAAAGLAPVVQLLRTHFSISDAQSREEIAAMVAAATSTQRDGAFVAGAVLSLLGMPVRDPAWLAADAGTRQRAVENVLVSILVPLAQRRRVVVVIEDLHWIDPESESILDRLVQQLPRSRILALVNYRPEYRNRWRRHAHAHEIALEPLAQGAARALLDDLLEGAAELDGLRDLVLARTSGNPLFIEETVHTLIDRGVIARQDGRLALVEQLDGVRMPQTIQSILAGRVDLLAPQDKSLLQSAAVAGASFLIEALRGIADVDAQALDLAIERLVGSGFLVRMPGRGQRELSFRHPLVHEVAYGGLLKSRRRELHRRALSTLETHHAGRLSEFAAILAEHARLGEMWEPCARYLRQAAANAYGRSANVEASRLYEQALEALSSAPGGRSASELRIDLCIDLRNSLLLIGEIGKILTYLSVAERVAAELGDRRRMARLASSLSHAYWMTGDAPRALQHAELARHHAESLDDALLVVPARYHAALIMKDLGRFPEANARLEALLNDLRPDQRHERFGLNAPLIVLAGSYVTRSLAETGAFAAARARGEEALRVSEEIELAFGRAMANLALGYCGLVAVDAAAATRHLEEAGTLFRGLSNRTMETVVIGFLGWARLLQGNLAEAASLVEESVRRADAMGLMSQQPLRMALLGETRRRNGDPAGAIAALDEAIRFARQQREAGSEAYACWFRGQALLDDREAPPTRAAMALLRGLALARRCGMRPLAAACRAALAEAYRALGRVAAAEREAAAAADAYRELGILPLPIERRRPIAGLTAAD